MSRPPGWGMFSVSTSSRLRDPPRPSYQARRLVAGGGDGMPTEGGCRPRPVTRRAGPKAVSLRLCAGTGIMRRPRGTPRQQWTPHWSRASTGSNGRNPALQADNGTVSGLAPDRIGRVDRWQEPLGMHGSHTWNSSPDSSARLPLRIRAPFLSNKGSRALPRTACESALPEQTRRARRFVHLDRAGWPDRVRLPIVQEGRTQAPNP